MQFDFDRLRFKYTWRPYQNRVLNAIDLHLNDKRLHIVAAPGAGKTTLGLEVFRKLGKAAVVFSPTRVIRDQWLQRLQDFCSPQEFSALQIQISRSLDKPGILTSLTYQALHARLNGVDEALDSDAVELAESALDDELSIRKTKPRIDELVQHFQQHSIHVLILDEAHHLRAEWWKALEKVCLALPDLIVVALTATPPYEARDSEWKKYESLCGSIDEEISVPELVKAGTLCAHQDFIWAVNLDETSQKKLKQYDQRVMNFCQHLYDDAEFKHLILSHPWLAEGLVPSELLEKELIKSPEFIIAMLAFLKSHQYELPMVLLSLLDIHEEHVPEFGRHLWQVLLETVLFTQQFQNHVDDKHFIHQLKKQLRSIELLKKQQLHLEHARYLQRSLSLSRTKINACLDIHQLEYSERGNSLRQVILTDYIRDEFLTQPNRCHHSVGEVNLGAWPIFQMLCCESHIPEKVALLTGRLVLISQAVAIELSTIPEAEKLSLSHFEAEMSHDSKILSGHVFLQVQGPLNIVTQVVTQLLMQGNIQTLVGTRALLGEGWDAPSVNSLVLASVVGSFMLTNQMRGRAIRQDRQQPHKVSSIWHIVAIDTETNSGLRDLGELMERFSRFVGLSESEQRIESGFKRIQAKHLERLLRLASIRRPKSAIKANNDEMAKRLKQRNQLYQRWLQALESDGARVLPSVKTQSLPGLRWYHFKNTGAHLLQQLSLTSLAAMCLYGYLRQPAATWLLIFVVCSLGMVLYRLPTTWALVKILCKHLPIDGAIQQISKALLEALCVSGHIQTVQRQLDVIVSSDHSDGHFDIALYGGSYHESALFASCIAELLAPVDSPRYLLKRSGRFYGLKRHDYHAVPLRLGVNKSTVEIFHKAWLKHVGPADLIYTRNPAGRSSLVKAKVQAFSNVFSREVKRQDRWQSS